MLTTLYLSVSGACLTLFVNAETLECPQIENSKLNSQKSRSPPQQQQQQQKTSSVKAAANTTFESDDAPTPWWAAQDDDILLLSADRKHPKKGDRKWVGVTIVMLTRWPFLKQLQAILRHHYCVHLQPRLLNWEDAIFEDLNIIHKTKYPQLMLSLSDIIVKLCVDLPIPIPGLFSIRLNLPGDHAFRTLTDHEKKRMKILQDSVLFRLSLSESLPDTHFSLDEVLLALGPRTTLSTVCCALFQCKILFHSKNLSILPGLSEILLSFIYE